MMPGVDGCGGGGGVGCLSVTGSLQRDVDDQMLGQLELDIPSSLCMGGILQCVPAQSRAHTAWPPLVTVLFQRVQS